jgi:asparagine synthase (glutamine-hydrolysing)
MCGFAGIFDRAVHGGVSPPAELLRDMGHNIRHRGPDDEGIYSEQGFGCVHRRLSIIDLATGQQPMLSQDANLVLVFNGEIFNFVELREQLVTQGYQFTTQSDTEVILHLYQRDGLDFVSHLNGQFAIALWDKRIQQLLLIRDRVGICPLFYTVDQGQLVFGSEVKALKPALSNGLSLSAEALDQIFTFWAPVSPNTIFKNVFEVPPGHMMIVDRSTIKSIQYWEWSYDEDFSQASEEQSIGELHDLLIDASKIRLRSDVPVGAYLSGGLDSSSIVALIHKYGNVPLRTFSLNFDQGNFDEANFQQALVKKLGTEHSNIMVGADDIAQAFEDTIYHTEAPILRTAPVPMGLLSGLVKDNNFKVVLTGEGADEVFGGYDIFKEAKVRRFWSRNPHSQWRPLLLKRLYPYLNLSDGNNSIYLKSFFGQALDSPDLPYFSHIPRWTTTAKAKAFFSDDLNAGLRGNAVDALTQSLPKKLDSYNAFNRAQYIESKTLMSGYLLNSQSDRMLMKNSIEGRFPFLDHRLIEFANKLHPKIKMKVMNEKYVLKKAMARYLPADIIRRHKQPYRAPDVNTGSNQFIGEESQYHLSEKMLKDAGFFSPSKVSILQRKAAKGKPLSTSESQALTGILSTQIVYSKFIKC